jgi:molybdopterin-guanine dinucleotide biosynthesis protein B
MKAIHIVGRKGHGKTTLVCEIAAELSARGVRVGTFKHCGHAHELDRPGSDSCKHRAAGAEAVAVAALGQVALHRRREPDENLYPLLARWMEDMDIVLIEGDVEGPGVKVEVWRAEKNTAPLAAERGDIVAVVTDDPLDVSVPLWPRSDIAPLADRVRDAAGDI